MIVDEFQQFFTETFANSTIQKVLEIIQQHIENNGNVRFLTANELIFNFDFIDNIVINDFQKDEKLKPLFIYEYDNKKLIETISHFVNNSHSRGRKILSLTNRTAKHDDNIKLQKLTGLTARNLDATNKNDFDFSNVDYSIFGADALNSGVNIFEKNTDCFFS